MADRRSLGKHGWNCFFSGNECQMSPQHHDTRLNLTKIHGNHPPDSQSDLMCYPWRGPYGGIVCAMEIWINLVLCSHGYAVFAALVMDV